MIVIGLFARAEDAEILLNNLAEADFAADHISAIAVDPKTVQQLTDVRGPLSGLSPDQLVDRLQGMGMMAEDAQIYRARLQSGDTCIAVEVDPDTQAAAAE